MGSGASFESNSNNRRLTVLSDDINRYYCHNCRLLFQLTNESTDNNNNNNNNDLTCIYCSSAFIEDFSRYNRPYHRFRDNLTTEQNRRITNASIMLRILEEQLREELELFQNSYNLLISSRDKNKPMTSNMIHKLRKHNNLSIDMICSLPSCPICTEDYEVTSEVTQMPCLHFCHSNCLLPWLEVNKTCPICRYELNDNPISINDLMILSIEEIKDKITNLSDSSTDKVIQLYDEQTSKSDLIDILKDLLDKASDKELQDESTNNITSDDLSNDSIDASNQSNSDIPNNMSSRSNSSANLSTDVSTTATSNITNEMPRPTYIIRSNGNGEMYMASAVPRSIQHSSSQSNESSHSQTVSSTTSRQSSGALVVTVRTRYFY